MKKEKIPVSGDNTATDVLETSEVLRAANCMTRMASGILGFVNDICKAEVFSDERLKEVGSSLDNVLLAYKDAYAALLARYSVLDSADGKTPISSK